MSCRLRVLTAALCCSFFTSSALADDDEFIALDLDGSDPAERVYAYSTDGASRFLVLLWNASRGEWMQIFDAPGGPDDINVLGRRSRELAQLSYGGRTWVWADGRYTPLVDESRIENNALPRDIEDNIRASVGVPIRSGTIFAGYTEPDGTEAGIAVLDGDIRFCAMGGGLCPAVLVRGDEVIEDIGVHVGYSFGASQYTNDSGHRLIEQGSALGVLLRDPDTGDVVSRIPSQRVAVSAIQPDPPEDL